MLRKGSIRAVILFTVAGLATASHGAQLAADNAGDTAYDAGWANGSNGGYGFGAWQLYSGPGGGAGFYMGSSTNNDAYGGGGSGNIDTAGPNTSGRAFGMYDYSNNQTAAYREFSGSLTVGQTFQIGFDNGGVDDGRTNGFELRGTDGVTRFSFYFRGGGQNYEVNGSATQNTATTFTTHGMQTAFTLTGSDSFAFTVAYNGAATETFTGTLGGTAGLGISNFQAVNRNGNGGPNNDSFINSLAIVPEPASLSLLGGAALLLRRRR